MTNLSSLFSEGGAGVRAASDLTDNCLIRGDGGVRNVQTTSIVVSDDGEMTNPSQPCFLAKPSETQSDLATGSDVTIVFGTEVFDVGNNFASNTFTAPVTGKYQISFQLRLQNLDTASTFYRVYIVTSNGSYDFIFDPDVFDQDAAYWSVSGGLLVDIDTNDTCHLTITQATGTAQTDIETASYFTGALIC